MSNTTPLTLPQISNDFIEQVAKKHNPNTVVIRKSDSLLMKIIGFILKPFNPTFNTSYITTIGAKIHVPDEFIKNSSDLAVLEVLVHETQHIIDYTKNPFLFVVGYLAPQIFALFAILGVLAFVSPWFLLALLFLLLLAPIPSIGRYWAELNGYRTSILFGRKVHHLDETGMQATRDWIKEQLSTGAYYWAFPFKTKMEADLRDESFIETPRYKEVTDFLIRHQLATA